ncbi:MAG: 2-oxoacid:ferredoxin oxidoreductase subunit beta [Gammaproteobacteria bacterium]|nr:2-oxoacid:ferredoxin oxidoreductase subunit beta [Gammaproteobacteria bacterium]NNF61352.1 2-oxoacid:ferredoxin oxidoreductase subunit beta [Gammaproteobacteria bacterium]
MSFIRKPDIRYKGQRTNALGLTLRDYEGGMSTLCAGCGHDSITSALVQAFFELDIEPYRVAKLSGIGCSSKTPAYFLSQAHGINAVHGRMPAVATGANAAARDLYYIGVSGDGDSLSIGLGQFAHAMRRNLHMLYLIENNGVYGLTKGQFSASADIGSKAKKGEINEQRPIDPVKTALAMGGTFVARGFSGDKDQLLPMLKAGLKHDGFAMIDVLSPCVTFNDHEDSTKSYAHTRQFYHPAVHADFIPPAEPIRAGYDEGEAVPVQLHDGSQVLLRKVAPDYDPHDRAAAMSYLERHEQAGEIVTGLLYIEEHRPTMHAINQTAATALRDLDYSVLNPGAAALAELQKRFR